MPVLWEAIEMHHQSVVLNNVVVQTKTPNRLCGIIYDSSIVPASAKVVVGNKESGHIVIGLKTEYDDYQFNLLLKKEEALAIVSALVSAIKRQESKQ